MNLIPVFCNRLSFLQRGDAVEAFAAAGWAVAAVVQANTGPKQRKSISLKGVKIGDVMSLVKFTVTEPHQMASVPTTELVKDFELKEGEEVGLLI